MKKREVVWTLSGFGIGAVAWVVIGLRAHAYDQFGILMLAGAALGHLAAKIVGPGKQPT
jgi:hypothetical protein